MFGKFSAIISSNIFSGPYLFFCLSYPVVPPSSVLGISVCSLVLVAQSVKNPPAMQGVTCNAGDLSPIPGSGRSSGEGHGNPFQYSCLENPMDRGTRQTTVHGVARVRHALSN